MSSFHHIDCLEQNEKNSSPWAKRQRSLELPKMAETNSAYENHLHHQLESINEKCAQNLLRLHRQSLTLRRKNASQNEVNSIGQQMNSILEHTLNIHHTIKAFSPSPQQFVKDHISSVISSYMQTKYSSKETKSSQCSNSKSFLLTERHNSKRLILNTRTKQGRELLKLLCPAPPSPSFADLKETELQTSHSSNIKNVEHYISDLKEDQYPFMSSKIDNVIDSPVLPQHLKKQEGQEKLSKKMLGVKNDSMFQEVEQDGNLYNNSTEVKHNSLFLRDQIKDQRLLDFEGNTVTASTNSCGLDAELKIMEGMSLEKPLAFMKKKRRSTEKLEQFQQYLEVGIESSFTPLWRHLGARFFIHNGVLCPKDFAHVSTLAAYHFCRTSSILMDFSFKKHLRLKTSNLSLITDSLIGCKPRTSELRPGDVRYGLVLDFKGKVMDDCWVIKPNSFQGLNSNGDYLDLVVSGFEFNSLYDFIKSHFEVIRKKKKIDCSVEQINDSTILSLQGPKSFQVLQDLISYSKEICGDNVNRKPFIHRDPPLQFKLELGTDSAIDTMSFGINFPSNIEGLDVASNSGTHCLEPSVANSLDLPHFDDGYSSTSLVSSPAHHLSHHLHKPYMSTFQLLLTYDDPTAKKLPVPKCKTIITCLRIGMTGEDGFEFIIDQTAALPFATILLWSRYVHEAGLYAYNMLRMESGFFLSGHDFTRMESPAQAGLIWAIDSQTVDDDILFGSSQIKYQLQRPRAPKLVGLLCEQFILPGCQIVSFPERILLGSIKSCSWSPAYRRRIAIGSIPSEEVSHGKKVLIKMSYQRSQTRKATFKKNRWVLPADPSCRFVVARVVQLPFVPHRNDPYQPRKRIHKLSKLKITSYKGRQGIRLLDGRLHFSPPKATLLERPHKVKASKLQETIYRYRPELQHPKSEAEFLAEH